MPGPDERTSHANMLDWIDRVAREMPLPYNAFPTGIKQGVIKACYQRLEQDKLDEFIGVLQFKLMQLGAECTLTGKSCGCALRATPTGEAMVAFQAILIGPFQD